MEDERIETRWFTAKEIDELIEYRQDHGRQDPDRVSEVEALLRR